LQEPQPHYKLAFCFSNTNKENHLKYIKFSSFLVHQAAIAKWLVEKKYLVK